MTEFDLAEIDRLLTTTKQVRKRMDLERSVPRELLLECIDIASHAPMGGNRERNRWLVVDDPDLMAVIAEKYQEVGRPYLAANEGDLDPRQQRVVDSAAFLVDHIADVYLRNDTAIKPVLRALVASAEFKKSGGLKVRDPSAEIVATYRALGVKVSDPPAGDNGSAARVILWQAEAIGAVPFDWPRPDGPPADNAAWSSPARLLASMDTHWAMSGGWWPSEGIRYRSARAWLPKKRLRFDLLVDHLSQQLLGRRSSSRLLQACVEVCPDDWKVRPSTRITMEHPLMKWGLHRLIATVLDSPDHFTR